MTAMEQQLMDHLIQQLDSANQNYNARLKARFPTLTGNELRLCNFLKSNLSTKEIAILLNITPESAKKAKHRLRKKLNMSPDSDFLEFLNQTGSQVNGITPVLMKRSA